MRFGRWQKRRETRSDAGVVPAPIAQQLNACAADHKTHLGSAQHSISFKVEFAECGEVDSVVLKDSTLGDEGLEACMAGALRSLSMAKYLPSARWVLSELVRLSEKAGLPVDSKWLRIAEAVAERFGVDMPVRDSPAEAILALEEITQGKQPKRPNE